MGVAANNLAWIYAQRSINLDRALELAKSAHQSLSRDPGVMDTLGYVYLRRREYDQAIVLSPRYEEAIAARKKLGR